MPILESAVDREHLGQSGHLKTGNNGAIGRTKLVHLNDLLHPIADSAEDLSLHFFFVRHFANRVIASQ